MAIVNAQPSFAVVADGHRYSLGQRVVNLLAVDPVAELNVFGWLDRHDRLTIPGLLVGAGVRRRRRDSRGRENQGQMSTCEGHARIVRRSHGIPHAPGRPPISTVPGNDCIPTLCGSGRPEEDRAEARSRASHQLRDDRCVARLSVVGKQVRRRQPPEGGAAQAVEDGPKNGHGSGYPTASFAGAPGRDKENREKETLRAVRPRAVHWSRMTCSPRRLSRREVLTSWKSTGS